MRKRYVLDAGVLALYFAGRPEARRYIEDVYTGRAEAFMLEVNVAEFLYNYARVFGWDAALVKHSMLRSSPVEILGVDEELTLAAAKLKLRYYNTLSLADCYLLALAKRRKATIVTTDKALKSVEGVNVVVLPL